MSLSTPQSDWKRVPLWLFVFAAVPLMAAGAQDPRTVAPGPTACAAAVVALTASSTPAPSDASWRMATRCGAEGGEALATALVSLVGETDTGRIRLAEGTLRDIRDASVFQAARTMAANTAASTLVRALALRVLIAQHTQSLMLLSLTAPPGSQKPCRTATMTVPEPYAGAALPLDYAAQATLTTKAIIADGAAPSEVKATAACLQYELNAFVPPDVDTGTIHLTYICGKKFRINNPNPDRADVTFDVDGIDDPSDLTVAPNDSLFFTTWDVGTTRLFYNPDHALPRGQLIQTTANGGTPCPP